MKRPRKIMSGLTPLPKAEPRPLAHAFDGVISATKAAALATTVLGRQIERHNVAASIECFDGDTCHDPVCRAAGRCCAEVAPIPDDIICPYRGRSGGRCTDLVCRTNGYCLIDAQGADELDDSDDGG